MLFNETLIELLDTYSIFNKGIFFDSLKNFVVKKSYYFQFHHCF